LKACWLQDPPLEIIKLLVENGAYVNAQDNQGRTALLGACAGEGTLGEKGHGKSDAIKFLLEQGADVNIADKDGTTPLLMACTRSNARRGNNFTECLAGFFEHDEAISTEIVELLLEKGANVNAVNRDGAAPLSLARKKGDLAVVELLMEKGADCRVSYQ